MYIHDHFLSDIVPSLSFSQLHFLCLSLTLSTLVAPTTLDLHSDTSNKKQTKKDKNISCWFKHLKWQNY